MRPRDRIGPTGSARWGEGGTCPPRPSVLAAGSASRPRPGVSAPGRTVDSLMISQREAVRLLSSAARPPLTPRLAEGVLLSGFAGPPTKLAGASLYDALAVQRLVDATPVHAEDLSAECRPGMLIVPSWATTASSPSSSRWLPTSSAAPTSREVGWMPTGRSIAHTWT